MVIDDHDGPMFLSFILRLVTYPFGRIRNRSAKKKAESLDDPTTTLGSRVNLVYIQGPQVYSCSNCRTHLATQYEVISRAFQGRGGRAYLFDNVVNVTTGKLEERLLMTGMHTVADITCTNCDQLLGWKYEEAFEESQKYKEGKFILEKSRIDRGEF